MHVVEMHATACVVAALGRGGSAEREGAETKGQSPIPPRGQTH